MALISAVELPDFSQPWKLSDVVLVVEDHRLHVHRAVLALCSPVFEKMFTSEFREKDANEVPLPGKKANEVKEMLQLIYPSVTQRAISEENCYFLVKLAHEYQMEALLGRCQDSMAHKIEKKPKNKVLADLVFAQTYRLEKLKLACVNQAHCLSLEQLKKDKVFGQIQPDNLIAIMEGIIKRLQIELEEAQRLAQNRQDTIQSMKSTTRRDFRDDRDRDWGRY